VDGTVGRTCHRSALNILFGLLNLYSFFTVSTSFADASKFMAAMTNPVRDEDFMREALRLARKAYEAEEVPVGAVVVRAGKIIARAHNQIELLKDATAHAEMLALTQAEAAVGDWRLTDCDLYVTKEPCVMCAGALVHVRMRRIIFGCSDPRNGAAGGMINLLQHPALNHHCEITAGVLQNECGSILQDFFRKKRGADDDEEEAHPPEE
jgi:tRNA(adenine34) deaminase